ncbi:MAG: hypothetical protein ACK4IT_05150 [Thioalkalivibrionaceae bacterium]
MIDPLMTGAGMGHFDRRDQIRRAHASLMHMVVQATTDATVRAELDPILDQALTAGWSALVPVLRRIVAGERSETLLSGLDEEDTVIVESILAGLQNPATLPDPDAPADASQAAPGLAQMIHAAARGDAQALFWVSQMAEQMQRAGGDMRRLGGQMKRLVDGVRDPDVLCRGMSAEGESLMLALLGELGRLERH